VNTAKSAMLAHQQQIAIVHAEAKLAITQAQGAVRRFEREISREHDSGATDGFRAAVLAHDRAVEMAAWVDEAYKQACRGLRRAVDESREAGEP